MGEKQKCDPDGAITAYLGNSTDCTRPNVWRGSSWNRPRPTKKVFHMLLPTMAAYASRWRKAGRCPCTREENVATRPTTASMAKVRTWRWGRAVAEVWRGARVVAVAC